MVEYNLAHSFMSFNTCYTDTGLWLVLLLPHPTHTHPLFDPFWRLSIQVTVYIARYILFFIPGVFTLLLIEWRLMIQRIVFKKNGEPLRRPFGKKWKSVESI